MIHRLTEPSAEPIKLADAKAHLRQDISADDALITAIIKAARDAAEQYCNRSWASATYAETFDSLTSPIIAMSYPDITAVASVSYLDSAGAVQTVTTGLVLDAIYQTVTMATLPPGTRYKVSFTAGPSALPPAVRQAMLLKITDMYENRAEQQWQALYTNRAAESLLYTYRVSVGI